MPRLRNRFLVTQQCFSVKVFFTELLVAKFCVNVLAALIEIEDVEPDAISL